MKKIFLLITLTVISLTSFVIIAEPAHTGTVDQEEGIYIYYRSKPVDAYNYLGTYKVGMTWDDKPETMFNKMIKKVKDKYPTAQGIIINSKMDACDAITYK